MSFDSIVLARSGLVAYWKLADGSGSTANDSSGNGHNGSLSNVTLGVPGMISGESDTAASFNGTSSVLDAGNPAALQIVGVFAIEMILKGTYPTTGSFIQEVLAAKGFDGSTQSVLRLFVNPPDAPAKGVDFSSYTVAHAAGASAAITWPNGQVHILACQYTGTQWEIYIDGVLVATTVDSLGWVATAQNFSIGAEFQGSATNFFAGTLEKVSVYNSSFAGSEWHKTAVAAGLASATITLNSLSVATTGATLTATFSDDPGSVATSDLVVTVEGRPIVYTVSGSGSTRTLTVVGALIEQTQVVKGAYVGTVATHVLLSATNASTVRPGASAYYIAGMTGFCHFTSYTFDATAATQADFNAKFNPTLLDVGQWLDVFQAAGCRRVIFTAKHGSSWCMWPTESGAPSLGLTPWYDDTGIDLVRVFVAECRARGISPGLYLNFYDPWYLTERPGHDGTYGPQVTFTAYIKSQIGELLSNYGPIDVIWLDSWSYGVTYTYAPLAEITAYIRSLQPDAILVNNDHSGGRTASDIAEFEWPGQSIPSTDTNPQELTEAVYADDSFWWTPENEDNYKDEYVLAKRLKQCLEKRCVYLLNFPPDDRGLMPDSQVTWANSFGAITGTPGGPILLLPENVRAGVDRGDGILGTYGGGGGGGGGINGTGILGMT